MNLFDSAWNENKIGTLNRMAQASQPMTIAEMRRYLERVDRLGREQGAILPFDVAAIDDRLPHGATSEPSVSSIGHLRQHLRNIKY